jgi:hypothetical protein
MNTITESTNQSPSASTHNQPDNKDVEEQDVKKKRQDGSTSLHLTDVPTKKFGTLVVNEFRVSS